MASDPASSFPCRSNQGTTDGRADCSGSDGDGVPPLPSARSIFLVLSDSLRLRTKAEVAFEGACSAADVPVEACGEAESPEAQGSGDGGEIPSLSSARASAEAAIGLDMEASGGRV